MPKWVMNKLVLKGKEVGRVADEILSRDKDNGKEYMDFNNIIRMPDSLNIVCGSCTAPAAEYYLSSINPNNLDVSGEKVSEKEYGKILDKINQCYGERKLFGRNEFGVNGEDFDTLGGREGYLNYGKTIIENRMNYGHSTWYEWSRENWGVKWNASSSRVQRDLNEVTIFFETPWEPVTQLMSKIGEKYKDIRLEYDASEEQTAFYEKRMVMENGKITEGIVYEPDSKEAMEHFMKIWEVENEFVYDPLTDNYISKYAEKEKGKEEKTSVKEKEGHERES